MIKGHHKMPLALYAVTFFACSVVTVYSTENATDIAIDARGELQANDNSSAPAHPIPLPPISSEVVQALGQVLGVAEALHASHPLISTALFEGLTEDWMPLNSIPSRLDASWALKKAKRITGLSLEDALSVCRNASVMTTAMNATAAADLLVRLADLYGIVKEHARAVEVRRRALKVRLDADVATLADAIESYAAMATDLRELGKYEEGIRMLKRAVDAQQLDAASSATLAKIESSLHSCKGDDVTALAVFESGTQVRASAGLPAYADGVMDVLQHIDLLKRVSTVSSRALSPLSKVPPQYVRQQMEKRAAQLADHLVQTGPWERVEQLPKSYTPGLLSKPWHDLADFPQLEAVQKLLEAKAESLKKEFLKLRQRKMLFHESECIHNSNGGAWQHYSINGIWLKRDENGCSITSPVACKLVQDLKALNISNFSILRAGYSAIDTKAHLHPHFGMSNMQLKMHLGVIVPTKPDGKPCARIRVGSETRAWEQGKVLFFDDSYDHEVWNDCPYERVIFQLVFVHPNATYEAAMQSFRSTPH